MKLSKKRVSDYRDSSLTLCEQRYVPAPQRQDTVRLDCLDKAISKAIVDLLVRRLVHQSSTEIVGWRHCAGHKEACDGGAAKGCFNVLSLPPGIVTDITLRNVVHTHLGSIEDTGTKHISLNSTIEAGYIKERSEQVVATAEQANRRQRGTKTRPHTSTRFDSTHQYPDPYTFSTPTQREGPGFPCWSAPAFSVKRRMTCEFCASHRKAIFSLARHCTNTHTTHKRTMTSNGLPTKDPTPPVMAPATNLR